MERKTFYRKIHEAATGIYFSPVTGLYYDSDGFVNQNPNEPVELTKYSKEKGKLEETQMTLSELSTLVEVPENEVPAFVSQRSPKRTESKGEMDLPIFKGPPVRRSFKKL